LVLHTGLDVMTPYHRFGGAFVQVALPASSRTSPFSAESAPARELAVDLMRQAADASRPRPPKALRERMPMLLWLAYLGITLHWIVDSSPDQARTRRLVDGVAPIVGRAVRLSRLPVAGRLVDDVVGLLAPATAARPTAGVTPTAAATRTTATTPAGASR
ncbi:MAG: TetR family transcriptional regulator C-terminal domain-containing protein, partial [Actinomycetota bacterium]|nr:TetR family transcriptional regulator C-terminal domain-containing protein [Actinomycetota bacterium]